MGSNRSRPPVNAARFRGFALCSSAPSQARHAARRLTFGLRPGCCRPHKAATKRSRTTMETTMTQDTDDADCEDDTAAQASRDPVDTAMNASTAPLQFGFD